MSFLPSAGLVAGGASLALSGGSAVFAGNAFNNAIQGNSTDDKNPNTTSFQRGVNALVGNTSDTTTQLIRHVAEGTVFAGASLASAATAAATLDTEGSYTFGLGNFGFDLSKFTLFKVPDMPDSSEQVAQAAEAAKQQAAEATQQQAADAAQEAVADPSLQEQAVEFIGEGLKFAGENWKMIAVGLSVATFVPLAIRQAIILRRDYLKSITVVGN